MHFNASILNNSYQAIPRTIYQVGLNMSEYSYRWIENNPEYSYRLLNDYDCEILINKINDNTLTSAYAKIRVGVIIADICRLAALYLYGGVYLDLDVIPYGVFRNVIPSNATYLSSKYYAFEMFGSVPRHPFIEFTLFKNAQNILKEVYNCKNYKKCCRGSYSCVLKISGPKVYGTNIINISKRLGCSNRNWPPVMGQCKNSLPILQNIHVCRDTGLNNNFYRTTYCGIAKHADCRNSGLGKPCSSQHYNRKRIFYDYT